MLIIQGMVAKKPNNDQKLLIEHAGHGLQDINADFEVSVSLETLENTTTFDSIIIWDHELIAESHDSHIRGFKEWVMIADRMHNFDNLLKQ